MWLPCIAFLPFISLPDGDIIGDLETRSESAKNLICHAHWKIIDWLDSGKHDFSMTTSQWTGFPLLLRGWICQRLPLRARRVIWHILVSWQWMFTRRFTTSWHSLTYKWRMETKILLTQTPKHRTKNYLPKKKKKKKKRNDKATRKEERLT